MRNKILTYAAWSIISLNAVAFSSLSTASPLRLKDDGLINLHKGDVRGFFNAWLVSNKTGRGKSVTINCTSASTVYNDNIAAKCKSETLDTFNDVVNGFERFCEASNGRISHPEITVGYDSKCHAKDGRFIGSFLTINGNNSFVIVNYDDPATVEWSDARKLELDETLKAALNGPTGTVLTSKGRFPFLYLGSLQHRMLVEVLVYESEGYDPSGTGFKYIPLTQISRIDFNRPCCDVTVTQINGGTATVNATYIRNRSYGSEISKMSKYPFVLLDPEEGKVYEDEFSSNEIVAIEIDPENHWKGQPEAAMKQLAIYRTSSSATTLWGLTNFIKTYKENDPEGLIENAMKRLPALEAQEARLDEIKRKEAAQIRISETRLDALKRKESSQKEASFKKAVNAFRRSVKVGDDSHCGLVIQTKGPVVNIQTMVGEHWFKISQIYPKGMAECNFYNNTYQEPSGLPL